MVVDASAAMSAGAEVKHALLGAGLNQATLMKERILIRLKQHNS